MSAWCLVVSCMSREWVGVLCMTGVARSRQCEYYSRRNCISGVGTCHATVQSCLSADPDKRQHCYTFWNISTGGVANVILQGCWLDSPQCYNHSECVATHEQMPDTFFCCCERDLCNVNFTVSADITTLSASPPRLPAGSWLKCVFSLIIVSYSEAPESSTLPSTDCNP